MYQKKDQNLISSMDTNGPTVQFYITYFYENMLHNCDKGVCHIIYLTFQLKTYKNGRPTILLLFIE